MYAWAMKRWKEKGEWLIFIKSGSNQDTVVCRAAQEAGAPHREYILQLGRKKTRFSHLCSSMIPYPIETSFTTEVPAR